MATLNVQKLTKLDWVILGAALIAFIALFLPWYGVSSGIYSASVSGWSTSYGWLGALLIIAAGVYHGLYRSEVNLEKMPVGPTFAVFGASLIGTLIVALRWLTLPSGHASLSGVSLYSYGPRAGIIIAIIAGVAQAIAALIEFRASSETVPWAKATSAGGGSTSAA